MYLGKCDAMAIVAEEAEDDILQDLALAASAGAQPMPISSAMETIDESDCADGPPQGPHSFLRPSFSSANSLNRSGVGLNLSRSRGKVSGASRESSCSQPSAVGLSLDLSGSNGSSRRSAGSSSLALRRLGSSGRRLSESSLDVSSGSANDNTRTSTGQHALKKIISTEPIDARYHVDYTKEIGRGTNTIVRKAIDRSTGQRYAVKTVKKFDADQARHMRHEIHLLHDLSHPSIIDLVDCYEDDQYLHMVVELCRGGELYEYVMKRVEKTKRANEYQNPVDEQLAANIVRKICSAVAYLHEHDIVHRDLKLENILFVTKPSASNKKKKDKTGRGGPSISPDVRLIDFGLSKSYNTHHRFSSLQKLTSFVGTNYYVAPEVLSADGYTHSCDLWGIGVLAYALLSAKPPFNGRSDKEIYYKIKHCDDEGGGVQFPSPDWDAISDEAKNFIAKLLVRDVSQRPSAAALLNHPWIQNAKDRAIEEENGFAAGLAKPPKRSLFKKVFGFRK